MSTPHYSNPVVSPSEEIVNQLLSRGWVVTESWVKGDIDLPNYWWKHPNRSGIWTWDSAVLEEYRTAQKFVV